MSGLFVYALIFSVLFFYAIKKPAIGITAVFLMFTLEQIGQSSTDYLLTHRALTNILIGLVVLVAFTANLVTTKRLNLLNTMFFLVLILFSYAFLTLTWSPYYQEGIALWAQFIPYLILTIIIAPILLNNHKDILISARSLLVLGLPLFVILIFFAEWQFRQLVLYKGIDYIYGNPLEIGTFAAVSLVAASFDTSKGFLWVCIRVAIILLSISLLVISGTRGQLFAVILAIYSLWCFRYRISNPINFIVAGLIVASFTLIISVAVSYFGEGNIRWSEDRITQDIQGRFENSLLLLEYWSSNAYSIVFGLGNSASYELLGIYPHNLFAEILGEEGIIGFLFYGLILLMNVYSFFSMISHTKPGSDERAAGVVVSGWLLISFILSMKQGNMLGNMYFFMFSILLYRYQNHLSYKRRVFIQKTINYVTA